MMPPSRLRFIPIAAIATPLGVLLLMAVSPWLFSHEQWARVIDSEHGILEWLTVVVLTPAIVACAWVAVKAKRWPQPARVWFAVLALGLFYFAGEEASWGQHAFGFTPPANIAEGNLQGEFNLHNADAWYHDLLNEIPRTLAAVFCVGVCGILPWWKRTTPRITPRTTPQPNPPTPDPATDQPQPKPPTWWAWLVPGKALVVAGLSVGLIAVIDGPFDGSVWDQPGRWLYYALTEVDDELKEALMAVTLCFYSLDRLQAARHPARIDHTG